MSNRNMADVESPLVDPDTGTPTPLQVRVSSPGKAPVATAVVVDADKSNVPLPLNNAGGAPSTERTKVAAIATKAKQAKRVAGVVASGSYIPLFTDKVRNNVRSRPLLIGIYAVSTAFVCLLLIFAFSMDSNVTWTARFATPPPSTAYLGEPMSTFTFEVVDSNNKGVANQLVYVFISPATSIDLQVTLQQGTMVSRTIECVSAIVYMGSTTAADDVPFCDASTKNFVVQYDGTTDARGLVKFSNYTLGYGVVGSYIMTVGLRNYPSIFSTHVISVTSNVQRINIDQGLPTYMVYKNNLSVVEYPVINAYNTTQLDEFGADVEITIGFVPSIRFQASFDLPEAEAMAEQAAAYFNIPAAEYLQTIASQFQPMTPHICASIISLDMQKSGYRSVNSILEPLRGPINKGQRFLNNVNCTNAVRRGNISVNTGSGVTQEYFATIRFSKFAIVGSNTKQMFLGVSAMGMIVPLPFLPLDMAFQTPSQVILAALPATEVASVVVTCPLCVEHNFVIVEGTPIGSLRVMVTDSNGVPLSGRMVYMYANPSLNNTMALGAQAMLVPHVDPKRLLFEVSSTDETGVAVFDHCMFTVTGAPGNYDVFAMVDGVDGKWSPSPTPSRYSTSNGQPFQVLSAVSSISMIFTGGNPDEVVEYVGESWTVLPVIATWGQGGQPIPGKVVDIVAEDTASFAATSKSLTTSDGGVALIVTMVVTTTNATVEQWRQAAPQLVRFNVVVDRTVMVTFSRWIAPPRNYTWVVAPPSSTKTNSGSRSSTNVNVSYYGPCAYIQSVSYASLGFYGLVNSVTIRSVDAFNNPVPHATFNLTVDGKYLPPLPGMPTYGFSNVTDANGLFTIPVNFGDVPNELSLVANVYCANAPENVNYMSMTYVSRVRGAKITDVRFGMLCASVDVRDWTLVNSTNPLSVTVQPVWYPSYVVNYLSQELFPLISVVNVSTPAEAAHFCMYLDSTSNNVRRFPQGLYGFMMTVDSNFVNPVILSGGSQSLANFSVRIERSMFEYYGQTIGVGVPLPQQPIVKVINLANGELPEANISVFVNLAIVDTTTGARNYQDIYSDMTTLVFGGFTVFDPSAPPGSPQRLSKAISSPSNASGYAHFHNITIVSGPPAIFGKLISVRYCVTLNALTFFLTNGSYDSFSVCVDDPNAGSISFTESLLVTVDRSTVSGSPSQVLPPLTVQGLLGSGVVPIAMMCSPVLIGAPQGYFEFPNTYYTKFDAYGTFFANDGATLVVANQISLSALMPEGNYFFQFVCSGGFTRPISLIVTSTPGRVLLTTTLPSQIGLSQIIPIGVQLLSASATPIANAGLEMTLQSTTEAANCTGLVCGSLNPASVLYATTDLGGNALFTLAFDVAATSTFVVHINIASELSSVGVEQAAKTQLRSLSHDFGTSLRVLLPALISALPELTMLLQTAEVTAQISTQRSTIVLEGGAALPVQPTQPTTAATGTTTPSPHGINSDSSSSSGSDSSTMPFGPASGWKKMIFGGSSGSGPFSGVENTIKSYVSPLLRLVETLKSLVGDTSGGAAALSTGPVSIETTLSVINSVGSSLLLRDASIPTLHLPLNVNNVVQVGLSSSTTYTVETDGDNPGAPIVQFFEGNNRSNPAVNTTVMVEVLPWGTGCYVSQDYSLVTDGNGTVVVGPLSITASVAGNYTLRISAAGGAAILTRYFTVEDTPAPSRLDYMEYLAIFLICFFSPMLMASVPHSRKLYMVLSCIVTIIAAFISFLIPKLFTGDHPLYSAYFYFLMVLTFAIAGLTFVLTVVDGLGYRCCCFGNLTVFRFANDEEKALRIVRYVKWIVNIRLRHQSTQWETLQKKTALSPLNRIKIKQYEMSLALMQKVNNMAGEDVLDQSRLQFKTFMRRRRVIQDRLLYDDSEAFDPVYVPINFLIVVGIAIMILTALCFIIVYLYSVIVSKVNLFLSYLPNVNDGDDTSSTLMLINKVIVTALIATVDVVVHVFPAYSNLSLMNRAIADINLVQILADVREYIAGGLVLLEIAFWIAGSVAGVAFLVTIALTWLSIPNTIRQIRRGQLATSPSISSVETYIGMHVLQLVIMHQIVFWPVVVIVCLLAINPLRIFIWGKLEVIILAAIVSYLTQTLVQKIIVSRFLSNGSWSVVRPELYSIWHFVGLILGIFSGLVKSAVRWAMSLGLVSVLFARLDQAIFPEVFASMDQGHGGFMSVVAVEAKNGNPIYILFATHLILTAELRRKAADELQRASMTNGSTTSEVALRSGLSSGGASPVTQSSTVVSGSINGDTSVASPPVMTLQIDDPTGRCRGTSTSTVTTEMETRCSSIQTQACRNAALLSIPPYIVDDTFMSTNYDISAAVKNCSRILLREMAGCPLDLQRPLDEVVEVDGDGNKDSMSSVGFVTRIAGVLGNLRAKVMKNPRQSEGELNGENPQQQAQQCCDSLADRPLLATKEPLNTTSATEKRRRRQGPFLVDITAYADGEAWRRRERVKQRFWLLVLLTLNPSLIAERKKNLYVIDEAEGAEEQEKE